MCVYVWGVGMRMSVGYCEKRQKPVSRGHWPNSLPRVGMVTGFTRGQMSNGQYQFAVFPVL